MAASCPPPAAAADNPPRSIADLAALLHAARSVVVVCGAGMSTSVGIPDFRSAGGVYDSTVSTPSVICSADRTVTARSGASPRANSGRCSASGSSSASRPCCTRRPTSTVPSAATAARRNPADTAGAGAGAEQASVRLDADVEWRDVERDSLLALLRVDAGDDGRLQRGAGGRHLLGRQRLAHIDAGEEVLQQRVHPGSE